MKALDGKRVTGRPWRALKTSIDRKREESGMETNAQLEIEQINRDFAAGKYSFEQYARLLRTVIAAYDCQRRIVKTHANGIKHIEILDKDGNVIADYHDTQIED